MRMKTPRTDPDLLVTHACDYAPCRNPAQVVLTHPRTGQYLLLVCAPCAPRYRAMLAQPGLLPPGVPRRRTPRGPRAHQRQAA